MKQGHWTLKLIPVVQLIMLIVAAVILTVSPVAHTLSAQDRRNYTYNGIEFIDEACLTTSVLPGINPNKEYQDINARIIIGVAKTYNLGREGALIGLMTGIVESGFSNLANDGTWRIPQDKPNAGQQPYLNTPLREISESFPHDDIGNDNDSVGIMQQRPTTGWSTFGSGITREVISQLMNPVYAAQAFFGTPPGAQLPEGLTNPGALTKGLQNIEGGWQHLDPGQAAQKVQGSAFPEGYGQEKDRAQSILNRLWDSSPPLPLPVSVTGGSAPELSTACDNQGQLADLRSAIVAYAWPEYINPGCGVECARTATTPKDKYAIAVDAARRSGGYVGYNGIDCGGFVTLAMIDSDTDPDYNRYKGNTAYQIRYLREESEKPNGNFTKVGGVGEVRDTSQLYFGDVGIRSGYSDSGYYGHTFIYTGHFAYIDPESGAQKEWSELVASASGSGNRLSGGDRAPMAGKEAGQVEIYEWYRLRGVQAAPESGGL